MKQHLLLRSLAMPLTILLLSLCVSSTVTGQTVKRPAANTITLGLVSTSYQREIEEHFRAFTAYVARKAYSAGDAEGKVVVVSSLPELAELLNQGSVDFFLESPYPTYIVNQVHGAGKLLLRRWKGGLAEYRSLIATAKDSGINRVDNLRGKIIAFKDPESTSGYFLPKFFLQQQGLKLAPESAPNVSVPATEIGYIFAETVDKIVELILTKRVAAGAISDDDFSTLTEEKKTNLNVLAQTVLLPRHLVSVRKDLPPQLSERLSIVLQSMNEDEEGRKILLKADNTTKFDPLPGGEETMRRRLLETFYSPGRRQ
jgi:phosphonate transport system substrate-binding protein